MENKEKYYLEIEQQLNSKDTKEVLDTIKEIRKTGHAHILPLLFNLVRKNPNQKVQEEVFLLLGQVKEKDCVNFVVEEISSGRSSKQISKIIASCWQSGLDYSKHILLFTKQFMLLDYQTAIEAFTVIEEWIHNSEKKDIQSCKNYLIGSISDITEEKKPLYSELIKLIDSYL